MLNRNFPKEKQKSKVKNELPELSLDIESMDKLAEVFSNVFTVHFGEFGFNLLLRYWDKVRVPYSKEKRSRTLPFDVMEDIKFNIENAKVEANKEGITETELKQIFTELLAKLMTLFSGHFSDKRQDNFYNFKELYEDLLKTIFMISSSLNLDLETEPV